MKVNHLECALGNAYGVILHGEYHEIGVSTIQALNPPALWSSYADLVYFFTAACDRWSFAIFDGAANLTRVILWWVTFSSWLAPLRVKPDEGNCPIKSTQVTNRGALDAEIVKFCVHRRLEPLHASLVTLKTI